MRDDDMKRQSAWQLKSKSGGRALKERSKETEKRKEMERRKEFKRRKKERERRIKIERENKAEMEKPFPLGNEDDYSGIVMAWSDLQWKNWWGGWHWQAWIYCNNHITVEHTPNTNTNTQSHRYTKYTNILNTHNKIVQVEHKCLRVFKQTHKLINSY